MLKCRTCIYSYPSVECTNCGSGYRNYKEAGARTFTTSNRTSHRVTNAQRIRAMSDEELAEFLADMTGDKVGGVAKYLLDWLSQPAEVTP